MARYPTILLALACALPAYGEEYTVRAGDTLWEIHLSLGHTIEDLRAMNPWLRQVEEKERLEAGGTVVWISPQNLEDYWANERRPKRTLSEERELLFRYVRYSPLGKRDTGVYYQELLQYAHERRRQFMPEEKLPTLRVGISPFAEKVNAKNQ